MRPDDRDAAYLWDMLTAATDAEEIARDLTLDSLIGDRKSQLALSKALELIGEAANHLSEPFFAARPALKWKPIVNLRHRLVHDYGRTNFRILWSIVTAELPDLIARLKELLQEAEGPEPDNQS
jgi:uncharacterized protein with HEPN domain